MRLTPLIVARSQLLTAIELFFDDRDAVSVQSLAGNARELLEGLCRLEKKKTFAEDILDSHPGRDKKWLYGTINQYRNCFKHLGETQVKRDGDLETLSRFSDEVNEFLIYVCIEDYLVLRGSAPVPFQIFHTWFAAKHADLITDRPMQNRFAKALPGLTEATPKLQKDLGKRLMRDFINDPILNKDPRTEPITLT